ncbi:MAG TPA: MacB family efflux pump subunit [Alphaproteobacteria bacterium]|jgi:macrolide transport system ATP-binding/permease protein|nr:MacB family efflux pump subunit [Alphaproteobacteria bacterium]
MTVLAQPGPRPDNAAAVAPLIELSGITKTFDRGGLPVEVLHGVALQIYPGEFVAIMGASGSGKTTLMNLIGCLDRPTSGSYRFAGEEISEYDADARALLRRESFGFIFQQYNLLATATATENVEVPAIYAALPRAERLERAREILTSLGLGDRLDHRPNQLSGGEQQRVSISRALMNGGAVILADEPTGALDSQSGADVMRLLADLNARGHTVLLITHDPEIAKHARRIVVIKDGRIVEDSGPVIRFSREDSQAVAPRLPGRGRPFATFPDIAEAARMAMRSLRLNLLRTLLTLLGIIIGVASVVAMLAIGDGARQAVLERISAMGTNLLLVRPGAPNIHFSSTVTATLVPADAEAIAELPNVSASVPEYPIQVTVRYGNRDYVTNADSTTAAFTRARDWQPASGVFFSDADVEHYAPVVDLGTTVVKALFPPGENPIGKYVLINNIPFQVIGVMETKGATPYGSDQDDVVLTPYTTGSLRLFGQHYVKSITVQVSDVSRMDETQAAITRLLAARHRTEDFQIRNMAAILAAAMETQSTLTVLLGSIAAISLLVGGIGVMNIMLVSVTERTREIGIRMATGARKLNILLQFNTEAMVVCLLGGVIGVLAGLSAAMLFAYFGKPIVLSAGPVLLAFGCAFATGVVFGFLPARKAADLDPVVALGAE